MEENLKKPEWLKTPLPAGKVFFDIKKDLRDRKLVTVCEEAKCPNIGSCWNTGTATFMVLGDTCTRACRFCHIKTGNPGGWTDPNEPLQVAQSTKKMGLKYVVLTMVDRDDIEDGGASHVSEVVSSVREWNPNIKVELLTGDYQGDPTSLQTLLRNPPDVFAHNIETIERLSPRVRDARAKYKTSLEVLKRAKDINPQQWTKSSIMLGLGETPAEVEKAMDDLRDHGVTILTLGQYMRPTKKHLSVKEWVHPNIFKELEVIAYKKGFQAVASGPLVRSSHHAGELFDKL